MWTHLERQAGTGGASMAIGMRGPGEKQIEIDRRIVNQRITKLRSELAKLHKRKEREVRERTSKAFTVGLVGYTNAGKSTLMNALTDAKTYSADQLFATLDTKTRRWSVAPGAEIALSDTVGFVRKLPHHLVASFRSTLEEALTANLLLHVIDASHPQALSQTETVERVLTELECDMSRVVPVLNKIDDLDDEDAVVHLRSRLTGAVSISALTGQGLDDLVQSVATRRREQWLEFRIDAPAGNGKVQALVRSRGMIKQERFDEDRWIAEIEMPRASVPMLRQENDVLLEEL
jgi:GTP-binding protein HflX